MARVFDVLRLRVMITPILLEVLFWAGLGGTGWLRACRHERLRECHPDDQAVATSP